VVVFHELIITQIHYNNYIPCGADSVRSTSAHNINLIGDIVLNLWKGFNDEVAKMNLEDKMEFIANRYATFKLN
jgi:hypothetical protein